MSELKTIEWLSEEAGCLRLLDQTKLPVQAVYLDCHTVEDVWQAIKRLSVRGAPAIGIAAAYGVCLASASKESALAACDYLATSRPTAVNLFWALDRMRETIKAADGIRGSNKAADGSRAVEQGQNADSARGFDLAATLIAEARAIHEEDRQLCAAIGRHGADVLQHLPNGLGIITHCNTGALATGGDGTALAVIFELHRRGRNPKVFADETRPLLQGARLTMWELMQRGVDATLITDSMAAQVMREGGIGAVIVGADRIAANGDAANKIGTYGLAITAKYHNVPFYVAAPSTTFDLTLPSGAGIPIEQRTAEEITCGFGNQTAPDGAPVYNPAFDVAPAELIEGIVTEHGVFKPSEVASRLTL